MRNRRSRPFRHRSNDRGFRRHGGGGENLRIIPSHFSNGKNKNNFKSNQSAEKLLERYKILAKEASSSGDKILSENYLQHVDHFERIISNKNLNQNPTKIPNITKEKEQDNNSSTSSEINKDKK